MAYEAPREIRAAAAITANGNTSAQRLRGGAARLNLAVYVSAVSGTSPTLDLELEWSTDDGTTWFKGETADTFAQITAAKKTVAQFDVKAPTYRVAWTVGGTSPSFTTAIDEYTT